MKPYFDKIPLRPLACFVAVLVSSCTPEDGKADHYLLVAQAARQPVSTTLGTIVVVQQKGGKFLRMKAQGGKFQLPGDLPDATASDTACIAAPPDDALSFFTVVPASGECLLSVELLGEEATSATSSGTTGTSGTGGMSATKCTGTVMLNEIIPVSTTRTAVDATTTSSGTTGTSGTGGMSATSSGATGTGGAGGMSATSSGATGTGGAGGK
jgi:hypothetical protein